MNKTILLCLALTCLLSLVGCEQKIDTWSGQNVAYINMEVDSTVVSFAYLDEDVDTVSVEISRGWHTAYIALGSNLGDKQKYLDDAVQGLADTEDCIVEQVSDYLVTEPYGGVEQDVFLNGALKLRTLLTPEELLDRLHELEQAAHRERIVHWGPRTLDLDILLYDQMIIDTPVLHIPHIDMENRDFVLIPLTELAPYYRHPVLNKTISQLLKELQAK